MDQMKHRLHHALCIVSLILLMVTIWVWIRSYWTSDAVAYLSSTRELAVQTDSGLVLIGTTNVGHHNARVQVDHWPVVHGIWNLTWFESIDAKSILNRIGFGYRWSQAVAPTSGGDPDCIYPSVVKGRLLILPMWGAATGFAMLPTQWAWMNFRTQRRLEANRCVVCGYDLRATPDRCPECGAIPQQASITSES